MDASVIAAWYAAGVSTVIGLWQVMTYRREHRVRLDVDIETRFISSDPTGMEPSIRYRIRNRSALPVSVGEVGMTSGDDSWSLSPVGTELPRTIPPKEAIDVFIHRYFDVPNGPQRQDRFTEAEARFYAMTVDGRRFTSRRMVKTPERVEPARRGAPWTSSR